MLISLTVSELSKDQKSNTDGKMEDLGYTGISYKVFSQYFSFVSLKIEQSLMFFTIQAQSLSTEMVFLRCIISEHWALSFLMLCSKIFVQLSTMQSIMFKKSCATL